jgi:hypothetical protein
MVDGGAPVPSAEALVAPGVRAGLRPGRLGHAAMLETGMEVR